MNKQFNDLKLKGELKDDEIKNLNLLNKNKGEKDEKELKNLFEENKKLKVDKS